MNLVSLCLGFAFVAVCSGSSCWNFDNFPECNFQNTSTSSNITWQWSGDSIPAYNFPDPGGYFTYFDLKSYNGPTLYAKLTSPVIEINATDVFNINAYVDASYQGDELTYYFTEQTTGIKFDILGVVYTNGKWVVTSAGCTMDIPPHYDCCQGLTTCTGQLEISAQVADQTGAIGMGVSYVHVNDVNDCLTNVVNFKQ